MRKSSQIEATTAETKTKNQNEKMKTLTRKSLIKKLNALHEATEVGESQKSSTT